MTLPSDICGYIRFSSLKYLYVFSDYYFCSRQELGRYFEHIGLNSETTNLLINSIPEVTSNRMRLLLEECDVDNEIIDKLLEGKYE